MTRECHRCHHQVDISEIYVGRRRKNWPNPMCKECSKHYDIPVKYYEYTNEKMTPIQILLNAGYPKDYALSIINRGL